MYDDTFTPPPRHENIWSVEVVVPVDSLIQYRYVVTRGELGGAFTIVSLETFPEPRAHTCTLERPVT